MVFSLLDYKEWRNTLYKAGYAESIVHKNEQRLLTLDELEAVGQFFRDSVFAEPSRGQIPIEKAMAVVSTNYRISMELVPKTVFAGPSREAPTKRPKPEGADVLKNPNLPKKQRKSNISKTNKKAKRNKQ